MVMVSDILQSLSPKQWAKSVWVFLPLVISGHLFDRTLFFQVLIVAIAFGFCASAAALIHVLYDATSDISHPTQRRATLVSGAISRDEVMRLIVTLVVAAFLLCMFVQTASVIVLVCLILYLGASTLYSYSLKYQPIIDIAILAFSSAMGIAAGSFAVGAPLSKWLLLLVLVVATFLIVGNRLGERRTHVMRLADWSHPLRAFYSMRMLDTMTLLSAACIGALYSLYVLYLIEQHSASYGYILTIPVVIFLVLGFVNAFLQAHHEGNPLAILRNTGWIKGWGSFFIMLVIFLTYW